MADFARGQNGYGTTLSPPQSLDSERALLGSILLEPENGLAAVRAANIEAADFYDKSHATIFRALDGAQLQGLPITAIVLYEQLEVLGKLDDAGGHDKIEQLMQAVPHGGHAEYHAKLVKEKADRRWLAMKGGDLKILAHTPDATAADLLDFAEGISARFRSRETQAFPSMTAVELDKSRTTLDYLVEWMLVKGQPCIFAGGKKCLKTNILIDLGLSLSLGVRFLGQFAVPRAIRVALMSGESGQATIQETARRVALSKGYPLSNFGNLLFCFILPTLGDPQSMRALEQYIISNQIEVLIIDPAYLAMPVGDSAGNLFDMGRLLKSLAEIGQRTGCTIILCHHTRKAKADPFAPVELEDVAWSGFQEFARQWLLIGRRELYNAENGGEHKLWLNYGGSAGHSGLYGLDIAEGTRQDVGGRRWDVRVMSPSETRGDAFGQAQDKRDAAAKARREATLARNCEKLRKALKRFPEGETLRAVREHAGLNNAQASDALESLRDAGEVVTFDILKGKKTYVGIKLTGTGGTTGTESSGSPSRPGEVTGTGTTSPKGGCPVPVPLTHTNGNGSASEWDRFAERGRSTSLLGLELPPGSSETTF